MDWTPRLTQLNDVLADLIPTQEGITTYIRAAGLKQSMIIYSGSALDIWSSAIDEARKTGKIDNLVKAVLQKYPDNPFLKSALKSDEINYSLNRHIDEPSAWKGVDPDTLEVLTMGINTLLPINFLSKGVIRSKSVAKIEIHRNHLFTVGTGFVFKLDDI